MKFLAPLATAIALISSLSAADVPKIFDGLLAQDTAIKGQVGVVLPPPEIDKFIVKVEAAARKDPKWFKEFSTSNKPGAPLPYDAKLGLTQTEYDEYLVLWNKRAFKPIEEVVLLLRQSSTGTWAITSTGTATLISTLRYDPKTDNFRSPNGEMKRIEDVKADSTSILGEWAGQEWRFEEETGLGKTKENFAIGRLADKKHGILIYRAQELSTEGTRLLDKSLVIRFPLGVTAPKPAAKPATKK